MRGAHSEIVYGRHPVHETLIAGRREIHRISIIEGAQKQGVLGNIIQLAELRQIPVEFVSRDQMEHEMENHQGVVAEATPYPYVGLQDVFQKLETNTQPGLILLLDVLQDPQNVGTLLRTAEAVGVECVVLPHRRGASITPAVVRSSAGACEHLWITRANLARAINDLKKLDFWIVELDMDPAARPLGQVNLSGRMGLVVGGEGEGLRRLVRESCDFLMRLPMKGQIASLNAAVAGSIALYAVWQTRGFDGDVPDQ